MAQPPHLDTQSTVVGPPPPPPPRFFFWIRAWIQVATACFKYLHIYFLILKFTLCSFILELEIHDHRFCINAEENWQIVYQPEFSTYGYM